MYYTSKFASLLLAITAATFPAQAATASRVRSYPCLLHCYHSSSFLPPISMSSMNCLSFSSTRSTWLAQPSLLQISCRECVILSLVTGLTEPRVSRLAQISLAISFSAYQYHLVTPSYHITDKFYFEASKMCWFWNLAQWNH